MKLSFSNIAWEKDDDARIYEQMVSYGYTGLEIAPTRIFPERPYEHLQEAHDWADRLKKDFGLSVSSMQSIWYGRNERLFGSDGERKVLLDYTRKAVDFAEAVGCGNLVFGCPKNRILPASDDGMAAVAFFREIGEYARKRHCVVSIEPNPPIYNTNYINDIRSAAELINSVDSEGIRLNLDIGAMICNQEEPCLLAGKVRYIHHVHVSEPLLKPIQKRSIHAEIMRLLQREAYSGFVSVEMAAVKDIALIQNAMRYVKELFGQDSAH